MFEAEELDRLEEVVAKIDATGWHKGALAGPGGTRCLLGAARDIYWQQHLPRTEDGSRLQHYATWTGLTAAFHVNSWESVSYENDDADSWSSLRDRILTYVKDHR